MISLNQYAHEATEQQRKSMLGQGMPLNFIREIETASIEKLRNFLNNVRTHVYSDNDSNYHTADIHCALAAIHFAIAKNEGHSTELLEEISTDFKREMRLYLDLSDDKSSLEENLYRIVNTNVSVNTINS